MVGNDPPLSLDKEGNHDSNCLLGIEQIAMRFELLSFPHKKMTAAQAFIPHFSPLSASRTAPSHSCSCASKVTSSFVRQRPRLIFNKADNKANFGTWRGKGLVMVVNGAGASGKGRALIFDCDGVCGQCFYIVS